MSMADGGWQMEDGRWPPLHPSAIAHLPSAKRHAEAEAGAVGAGAVTDRLAAHVGPGDERDGHVGGELVARAAELQAAPEPAHAAADALLLLLPICEERLGCAQQAVVARLGDE